MNNISAFDDAGGAYHAIVGTLEQAGIATLITVPLGIARRDLHRRVRPRPAGHRDPLLRRRDDRHPVDRRRPVHPGVLGADRVADVQRRPARATPASRRRSRCRVLMLPTVVRSTEEMLRLVPAHCARARTRWASPSGRPSCGSCCRPRCPASSPASCWPSPGPPARPHRCCWSPAAAPSININPFERQPVVAVASTSTSRPATRLEVRARPRLGRRADPGRPGPHPHRRGEAARPAQQAGPIRSTPWPSASKPTASRRTTARFKAIDGITMTIEPKSVTALIGPSGCGKSTFLRSINRMHEVLPGRPRRGQPDHRRAGHLRP